MNKRELQEAMEQLSASVDAAETFLTVNRSYLSGDSQVDICQAIVQIKADISSWKDATMQLQATQEKLNELLSLGIGEVSFHPEAPNPYSGDCIDCS